MYFYNTPRSIYGLSTQKHGCQVGQRAGTNERLDLSLSLGEHLKTHLKEHTRYDQGPEIHGKSRKVSLPIGEVQLAGCLKILVSGPFLSGMQASSDYAQGVIQDTVYEASVSAASPDWCAVLGC